MKTFITLSCLAICLIAYPASATEIPGGYVSGDWYSSGNPYNVNGEITVHADSTLNIHEGVEVYFQGHYKFIVNGFLEAIGTEIDSILFTAADPDTGWHGIRFENAPDGSELAYCIVQYGHATGSSPDYNGGGMALIDSSPTISHCLIHWNTADYYAGGITVIGVCSSVISHCDIVENTALINGGIGVGGDVACEPLIEYCNIIGNTANYAAGGMGFGNECNATTSYCNIEDNVAPYWGGVMFFGPCSGLMDNCTISNNSSSSEAGGIYFYDATDQTLSNCTINDNNASTNGGGIYLANVGADVLIINCIISGNSAGSVGGGICCDTIAAPTIENCTITNNVADSLGGGIYCYYSDPTISECDINGNTAVVYGGGIYCEESSPNISQCIISGNTAYNSGGIACWYNSHATISECAICENQVSDKNGGIGIPYWSNPTISNCIISENTADGWGGGIGIGYDAGPTIENCIISENEALSTSGGAGGIGIAYNNVPVIISNCTIIGNSTGLCGGGIEDVYGGNFTTISNCTISGNSAMFGGGISAYSSSPTIENCTVSGNLGTTMIGAAGIDIYASASAVVNTIVTDNTGNGGIWIGSAPLATVTYGDFYRNQNGNFTGTPPPGLGTITGVNANGDSCDVFYNIFLNPDFVYPTQDDYSLQWDSPCIDAGDPVSPQDPDGTVADMGAWYYDQSMPLRILLTPFDAPITIPLEGGTFDYAIQVTNIAPLGLNVDAWCDVTLPDGSIVGPVLGPVNFDLGSEETVSRERTQHVPGGAQAGIYYYNAYATAGTDTSTDSFTFVKLEADGSDWTSGWFNTGESFDDLTSVLDDVGIPRVYSLNQNYPNPFNPVTTISYGLPENAFVKLTVYDLLGRRVVVLVNGHRDAGLHEVSFDATYMASGLYVYRLEAGEFTAVKKMILMK